MEKRRDVRHFTVLDSTNLFLKTHSKDLPDQTIVIADQQANGRGKLANQWISSNPNNLYLSILLKGSYALANRINQLTQFFALIAANNLDRILMKTNHKVLIKWPNDLLIDNKKVGGILAEVQYLGSNLQSVVLGIGINFDLTPLEKELISQPCTSLSSQLHFIPSKDKWTFSLLQDFFDQYEEFIEYGKSLFEDQLRKKLVNRTNRLKEWTGEI